MHRRVTTTMLAPRSARQCYHVAQRLAYRPVRAVGALPSMPWPSQRPCVTGQQALLTPTSLRAFATFRLLPTAARRGPRESVAPPPPLPDAKIVRVGDDCALEYIDLPPTVTDAASPHPPPTLVLLHGAPGTYKDFRHLIPLLQQQMPTARLVGINFPGFGGSSVDETRYFELLDAQRAAHLTLQALQQLIHSDARVFLVGHSFGGHAVLNLAALNQSTPADRPLAIAGLVLLAAAGTRPHRVLRPRQSALFIRALASSPSIVRHALAYTLKTFYTTLLKFPSDFPASHYVAGVLRAGTTDFGVVSSHVEQLRAAGVRSLSAWSTDDEFMEDEIPLALAAALRSERRMAFGGAGHNLQKTRAPELACEIASWVAHVESDGSQSRVAPEDHDEREMDELDVEIRP